MKNDDYKEQPGCHSCKHVFVRVEYEDVPSYYCTKDSLPRPLCGSILMNEGFRQLRPPDFDSKLKYTDKDPSSVEDDKWEKWEELNQVETYGICSGYEQKDK